MIVNAAEWPKLEASLDAMAPLVADGRIVWSQHEDVAEAWHAAGSVPLILQYDQLLKEHLHTSDGGLSRHTGPAG